MRNIHNHVQSFVDITREADTAIYAAGDVIAASTSAAVASAFPRCSKQDSSKGGLIQSAMLISSNNPATKLDADLFLFDAAPVTFGNDNDAFAPTDAEILTLVAAIELSALTAANAFQGLAGAGGNHVTMVRDLNIPYECANNDGKLYGVLVARNTYTPASAEVIRVKLGIMQG